ncbi:MAG: hypothetical protein QM710_07715 [Flavobacterium sp.]
MKKIIYYLFVPICGLTLMLYSCSSENSSTIASAASYSALKDQAVASSTQHFHFNAQDGLANFTSSSGVEIAISATALSLNGNPITSGQIDIEYVEIFDGGTMAATGKHTMGKMPNGKRAMLLSGGEFYINATKNGQQLDLSNTITLEIPAILTNGENIGNPNMTLWELTENDSVWVQDTEMNPTGVNGVQLGEAQMQGGEIASVYYAFINDFGWTNVDCFYEDPRQKTTILATAPDGYTKDNCSIYLHYDGRGNGLARLDTYLPQTAQFSEHYGQIPIGLVCHVIFMTESNGQWRYAIKPATISAGAVYSFTMAETTVGSEAQLKAAINALP